MKHRPTAWYQLAPLLNADSNGDSSKSSGRYYAICCFLLAGRSKRPGKLLYKNWWLLPHFPTFFIINFPLPASSLPVYSILCTLLAS